MAKIKITLVRSTIGRPKDQVATVRALGLHKLNSNVIHEDTAPIKGMVFKIKHLVRVENVEEV